MRKINVAIIGCGIITREMHLPQIKRLDDILTVKAVCNRSIGKALDIAKELGLPESAVWTDWESMIVELTDLDAVFIALPIPLNHPVSKACCEAGLSVLCEKPAGMSTEEAEDTKTFSKTFGVTYMTAENYQYEPMLQKAAELIEAGLIGKLHSTSWNCLQFMAIDNKYNKTQWRANNAYPGGYVMDGGVHFVHALQMLSGPITRVYAQTDSIEQALGTMDMALTLLTHENGVTSSLNMGWRNANDDSNLRLFGEKSSLIITSDEIIELLPDNEKISHPFEKESSFYLMWKDFITSLQNGKTVQMPAEAPARDVKVIMGIIESGKSGLPITIE